MEKKTDAESVMTSLSHNYELKAVPTESKPKSLPGLLMATPLSFSTQTPLPTLKSHGNSESVGPWASGEGPTQEQSFGLVTHFAPDLVSADTKATDRGSQARTLACPAPF